MLLSLLKDYMQQIYVVNIHFFNKSYIKNKHYILLTKKILMYNKFEFISSTNHKKERELTMTTPTHYEDFYDEDYDYLVPPRRNGGIAKKVYQLEKMNELYFKTCERTAEKLEDFLDKMQIYLGKLYDIKVKLNNDPDCQHYAKELDLILDTIRDQCYDMDSCVFDLDDVLYTQTEDDIESYTDEDCCDENDDCCSYDEDDDLDSCAQDKMYNDDDQHKI